MVTYTDGINMSKREEIIEKRFNLNVCGTCPYQDTCKVKDPNKCDVLNNE